MRLRYLVIIFTAVVLIGGSFVVVIAMDPKNLLTWASVVTALVTVTAALYAMYQYLSVRKVQRQEKSAEIMRTYASYLTHHVGLIYLIFQDSEEVSAIISKIDRKEPLRFTRDELSKFPVTLADSDKYYDFIFRSQLKDLETPQGHKYTDHLPADVVANLPEQHNLAMYILSTLNQLECICMEIESGAADTRYLYGSLHQTFMPFVHSAAMLIQRLNTKAVDAENYYPYVSRLYRRWAAQEAANSNEADKTLKRSERKQDRDSRRL